MVITYHMTIHVYQHEDGADTYSCLVFESRTPDSIKYPLLSFTGSMPYRVSGDPRPVLRAILGRMTRG